MYFTCPISIGYTVAVIGFTQTEYSVTEGHALSVSLAILQGSLGDLRLIVQIYTMDGSATSSGTGTSVFPFSILY